MEEVQKNLYILILAGGGGTRLWPQSRESYPKQFVKLFDGKCLFQIALDRAKSVVSSDHIIVSTGHKHLQFIKKYTKSIPPENIIVEPFRRDTALAIGVGAAYAYKKNPKAVVVNMASDHLISPLGVFGQQLKQAASLATKEDLFVTIGIRPKFPHPGLGHIKADKPYPGYDENVLLGERFVEKPSLKIAEAYTESGHYYWNTNLFVFKAKLLLLLLKKHSPKVYTNLPKLIEAIGTSREKEVFQLVFQMSPSVAIDYAVAEKLHKFICLPAKFRWTDVGDWKEVWNQLPKDALGNVISGPHGKGTYVGINSKNNLLFLDKKVVTTVGVEDMLIIDTPDAILICPKEYAQGVKQVVEALKQQQLTQYL